MKVEKEKMKRYEFNVVCLGEQKDPDLHCLFLEPSEGKAAEVYDLLTKNVGKLEHVHYVSGLMDNIYIKGEEGCEEWSNRICNFVSLDTKEDSLPKQIFYFAADGDKLLPSNQL